MTQTITDRALVMVNFIRTVNNKEGSLDLAKLKILSGENATGAFIRQRNEFEVPFHYNPQTGEIYCFGDPNPNKKIQDPQVQGSVYATHGLVNRIDVFSLDPQTSDEAKILIGATFKTYNQRQAYPPRI